MPSEEVLRLSPSSMGTFKQCPRLWKYKYVDRLPRKPPGRPAVLGTFVHRVLELLLQQPPADRSVDVTRELAKQAWGEIQEDPEFVAIDDGEEFRKLFKHDAWDLLARYRRQERPERADVVHTEQRFQEEFEDNILLHGIIDRVDRLGESTEIIDFKGLALDTPLPTPEGWTTMGEVQEGDTLIGGDGVPCQVTAKSKIHHYPCYQISFDDGSSVVADHEHLWQVRDIKFGKTLVMHTKELADNLFHNGQRNLKILNHPGLDLPEQDLPIDPYLLGVWLGDGKHSSSEITFNFKDSEVMDLIEQRGYELDSSPKPTESVPSTTITVLKIRKHLNELGLLGCQTKFIPAVYMRSSFSQRLDLLRGLMDSDGTWNAQRRAAVFINTSTPLAEGVKELASSLGWRPTSWTGETHGFGKTIQHHRVTFTPYDHNPFLLARKADKVRLEGTARARRRIITTVEEIPTVPTACVQVNSPDSTYLCASAMIVTHNTGKIPQRRYLDDKFEQLLFYVVALALNAPHARKMTLFYVKGKKFSRIVKDEDVEEGQAMIKGTAVDIRHRFDNEFEAAPQPLCGWCDYLEICPEGQQFVIDNPKYQGKQEWTPK